VKRRTGGRQAQAPRIGSAASRATATASASIKMTTRCDATRDSPRRPPVSHWRSTLKTNILKSFLATSSTHWHLETLRAIYRQGKRINKRRLEKEFPTPSAFVLKELAARHRVTLRKSLRNGRLRESKGTRGEREGTRICLRLDLTMQVRQAEEVDPQFCKSRSLSLSSSETDDTVLVCSCSSL
jgi:hypothetical protein